MQSYGGFGDFQIFKLDLLEVVATEWDGGDKGKPKAKILSHEQRKWGICGIAALRHLYHSKGNMRQVEIFMCR